VRRHDIDLVSLAAGLLFLVVAVVHIAARSTDTDLNLRWMAPAVLVLLGLLGLLGAIRGPRNAGGDVEAKPETEPEELNEAATER
jgi:protein-S-isoprenylcysteine O-methyltransferase Ste14